jgi:hypothetical protein
MKVTEREAAVTLDIVHLGLLRVIRLFKNTYDSTWYVDDNEGNAENPRYAAQPRSDRI